MIIAITTAPRPRPTLQKTIQSLRRAKFDQPIHIFAEPDSVYIANNQLTYHENDDTLGAFRNYHRALKWLLDNTDDQYIMVCQDDIALNRNARYKLEEFLREQPKKMETTGYISLYLSRHHKDLGKYKGFNEHKIDWHPCFWGALCYVFTRHGLKALLDNQEYKEYRRNEKIDCIICHCFLQMGFRMWYHSPSLVDHTGNHSTMGHRVLGDHRGYQFQV